MVQSPSWEANRFAASQEILRISRNPKVHYRTHKRPSPVSILGQSNPVHIPLPLCMFRSGYSVSLWRSAYFILCKCVPYYSHRVSTQLQLTTNISYIIPYHTIYHIVSYHIISHHISYTIQYHKIYHIYNISYHIISYHTISYTIYHII